MRNEEVWFVVLTNWMSLLHAKIKQTTGEEYLEEKNDLKRPSR